MKRIIKLTESDLHNIIRNSVSRIVNEERSGEWSKYELNDFARNVLHGIVWSPGIIRDIVHNEYRYKMKGRMLKITFPEQDGAEVFLEEDAESYPEYKFYPVDGDSSSMIVRCKYDPYWKR